MNNNTDRNELDTHLVAGERGIAPLFKLVAAERPMRTAFPNELKQRLGNLMREELSPPRAHFRLIPDGFWPVRASLAAGLAAALVAGVVLLVPHFTPEADARDLLNQIQNAGEVVPPGRVRHVVTTYTMTPDIEPGRATTLEQWFGNAAGRLVTRQTGLLRETTVVDAAGMSWISFQGSNEVVKIASGGPPILTPNRAVMNGIGAGEAQPRVVGHTSVNGRAATIMELSRVVAPLPAPPDPSVQSGGSGAAGTILRKAPLELGQPAAPPPDAFGFFVESSGALLVISPGGGTVVSQVVVDDETRQILQGHAVGRDQGGNPVGSTDWRVTADELLDASAVQPNLFVFAVQPGTPIREVAPGAPVTFDIRVDR